MHTIDISASHLPGRSWQLKCPEGWADLEAKDYLALGAHYPWHATPEFLLPVLLHFCRLRHQPAKLRNLLHRHLQPDQLYILMEELNLQWLFDLEANTDGRNHFPHIKAGGTWLHGWSAALRNLTIQEYSVVDALYLRLHQSTNQELLHNLIACMYRTKGISRTHPTYQGDVRVRFNPHQVEGRVGRIAALPRATQYALLLNFIGARNAMVKRFPKVFRKAENQELARSSIGGWGAVIIRLTQGRPTDMERINALNLYDTLRHMTVAREDADRIREDSEKLKRQKAPRKPQRSKPSPRKR